MYIRINGALILARGGSMIPMEELDGWMDADAHVALVKSAVEGNMNTIRLWGGGIFMPQVWYDECDRLGLMIYHDMMYCHDTPHAPTKTDEQTSELQHQMRRLSHHPAIVIWDGCNECMSDFGHWPMADFVMTTVAREDLSRPIWPACPAHGWLSGVHRLTSLPIAGGNLSAIPGARRRQLQTEDGVGAYIGGGEYHIEYHGPYLTGSGFPAVNGKAPLSVAGTGIPLQVGNGNKVGISGPQYQNVFVSEFGVAGICSFESLSPSLEEKHWGIHGGEAWDNCTHTYDVGNNCTRPDGSTNVMAQRNYPCDDLVVAYWGDHAQDRNATGAEAFQRQLYQCMMAQGISLSQNIQQRRGGGAGAQDNSFGLLVWSLNDIWPTGGWGSLEYGNPHAPGQVTGGRWKPIHYWYRSAVFVDQFAACDQNSTCFVRNDSPHPFVGTLQINLTEFATARVQSLLKKDVALEGGVGAFQWVHLPGLAAFDPTKFILEAVITAAAVSTSGGDDDGEEEEEGIVVSRNVVPWATPEKMQLLPSNVSAAAVRTASGGFAANVSVDAVSVFVMLSTLASGRFEDNAFVLRPPGRLVAFLPTATLKTAPSFEIFADSLRVEDVAAHQAVRWRAGASA